MLLPDTAHTDRPWRIHELTPDFELYDVWALPTPGGPDDFPRLVQLFAGGDTADNPSRLARALFAIRWKLGALLGWDDPGKGVGARLPTLRDRLPDDLRAGPAGPDFDKLPFTSVYLTDDEWAAEMATDRPRCAAPRLGPGRGRWSPRSAGCPGEAERLARQGLHGRDRTVPTPDRLSADDAGDRGGLADAHRAGPVIGSAQIR
jgi:hypothetical protein